MFDNQKTKEILASMLTENTGSSILDSGGAYGRNWEHNKGKTVESFEAESKSVFRATKWGDLEWTHSLFHWLESRLIYSEKLDSMLQEYMDDPDNARESYLALQQSFPDYLIERGFELGHPLDPSDPPVVINTYNGEDMLSQVIQYVYMTIEYSPDEDISESTYVILSVHGGCDVRGGYTMPRIFEESGDSEYAMFDNARGAVYCDHCHAYWDTFDGGYSWEDKGINGENWEEGHNLPDLNKLTIRNDESDSLVWELNWLWKLDGKIDYEKQARVYGDENILFALPTGEVVCPHCGEGILHGDFM